MPPPASFGGQPTALWIPFTYTSNSSTITITEYTGDGGNVTIPDTINGLSVTSIGPNAFNNITNLISIDYSK